MTYTIAVLSIFILVWVLSFLLHAFFLQLGLRWAKVEESNFHAALKATFTMWTGCVVLALGQCYFYGFGERPIAEDLIVLLLQIVCLFVVMKLFFNTSVFRSLQAFLPTFVSYGSLLALVTFVYLPFVGETFVVPTGSMAPTILGRHVDSRCQQCGQPAFVGTSSEHSFRLNRAQCICTNFHSTNIESPRGPSLEGDRVFVAKFLWPKRWELAVFRVPNDPNSIYVKRLVGLPGETIHIENGSVFAGGKKLTPPEDIANIAFSDAIGDRIAKNGTKDNPAVLGPEEYFILGDNTERSLDSRFWETGAPGHNPYAVPESYLVGVVTTIYWPPNRWRSFK